MKDDQDPPQGDMPVWGGGPASERPPGRDRSKAPEGYLEQRSALLRALVAEARDAVSESRFPHWVTVWRRWAVTAAPPGTVRRWLAWLELGVVGWIGALVLFGRSEAVVLIMFAPWWALVAAFWVGIPAAIIHWLWKRSQQPPTEPTAPTDSAAPTADSTEPSLPPPTASAASPEAIRNPEQAAPTASEPPPMDSALERLVRDCMNHNESLLAIASRMTDDDAMNLVRVYGMMGNVVARVEGRQFENNLWEIVTDEAQQATHFEVLSAPRHYAVLRSSEAVNNAIGRAWKAAGEDPEAWAAAGPVRSLDREERLVWRLAIVALIRAAGRRVNRFDLLMPASILGRA